MLHSNEIQTVTQIEHKTPLRFRVMAESPGQSPEAPEGPQSVYDNLDPYEVKYLDLETATEGLEPFRADVVGALWKADRDAAVRYAKCGQESLGLVGFCPRCEESNPDFYTIYKTQSCMLRICPECSKKHSVQLQQKYEPILRHMHGLKLHGYGFRLVTLTRNLPLDKWNLSAPRELMEQAMQVLEEFVLKQEHAGVITTLEIGELGGKWHAHALCFSKWIDEEKLSTRWKEITGSDYIVKVKRKWSVSSAIREGLKYITKFTNLRPSQLADLHMALKGTRRVRSRGVFYRGPNNPYRHIWGDDDYEGCTCPQCESPIEWMTEGLFLATVAAARPWLVGLSASEVADFEKAALAYLNLTEANKSLRSPP